jgi:hypothetical protein
VAAILPDQPLIEGTDMETKHAPRSVRALCVANGRAGYYAGSDGLVGVRDLDGDLIEWFRFDYRTGVYKKTGSTISSEDADYFPLISKPKGE